MCATLHDSLVVEAVREAACVTPFTACVPPFTREGLSPFLLSPYLDFRANRLKIKE